MHSNQTPLRLVPTNIITGFLGVGKTTAILQFMQQKPADERWAILVNEFGEIGIDGSLIGGQYAESEGVFIREVPGGCMCCAAGVPMQVALNQLLSKAKPDRLLIEPTGLGHPQEVLQVLSSEHYQNVLQLHNTITLVDARKLSDSRYTNHDIFNQQLQIADVIVGNKSDLYQQGDKTALRDYVDRLSQQAEDNHAKPVELHFTQQAELPLTVLEGSIQGSSQTQHHHHSHKSHINPLSDAPIPACGYLKAVNSGEGFYSIGWRFAAHQVFKRQALFALLSGLQAERMKAVFITNSGVFAYNLSDDALSEIPLTESDESCIEIITPTWDEKLTETLEAQLLNCLANTAD